MRRGIVFFILVISLWAISQLACVISVSPGIENTPVPVESVATTTQSVGVTPLLTSTPPPISSDESTALLPTETKPHTSQPAPQQPTTISGFGKQFFILQPGSPLAIPGFTHPEAGCNWMGVAGQVFGMDGKPLSSLIIQVGGILLGEAVFRITLTGVSLAYGEGGYELVLGEQVASSDKTLWVQVFDMEGTPLSEKVFFDTYEDCAQNLILINFVESSLPIPGYVVFLPVVLR